MTYILAEIIPGFKSETREYWGKIALRSVYKKLILLEGKLKSKDIKCFKLLCCVQFLASNSIGTSQLDQKQFGSDQIMGWTTCLGKLCIVFVVDVLNLYMEML
jgi:hypothetical protein